MLIGNLFGGLGNQMFQYSMLRSLSFEMNEDFAFNTDMIKFYNDNCEYQLKEVFNLNCRILSSTDASVKYPIFFYKHPYIRYLYSKLKINFKNFYFEGNKSNLQFFKSNNYLFSFYYGYWQNENYFIKYKTVITQDFNFILPTDEIVIFYYNLIISCNSVSIHIRRGDYKSSKLHQILDISYYYKAMKILESNFSNLTYFVFSDDINWVKHNFIINKNIILIDKKSYKSHFDMYLMSKCNHNIIANSTFSWWGAWLNTNPKKQVFAPYNWYNNHLTQCIPSDWNLI
jgi:hypothetical protein